MTQTLAPADPTTQGTWEVLPFNSEVLAVHAALLHTGKVLFAAGSGNSFERFRNMDFGNTAKGNWTSVVWDPSILPAGGPNFFHPDTLRGVDNRPIDFFCGGESFLADGTLLSAGGTLDYDIDPKNPHPKNFLGRRASLTFDPDPNRQQWTQRGDLTVGRWYPTLVTLGDGRVLAAAGIDLHGQPGKSLEVFSPQTNTWRSLGEPVGSGFNRLPLYAHLFLLADGRLLFTGGRMDDDVPLIGGGIQGAALLDLSKSPVTATPIGHLDQLDLRNQSASVLLPPAQDQRFMVIGGGPTDDKPTRPPATESVQMIDMRANPPTIRTAMPMHNSRVHLNAVLLPDRTVFVSGGASRHENEEGLQQNLAIARPQAEIYDPATDKWRTVATATVPRMYHSIALLLPDGRIVTAGGNPGKRQHVEWNNDGHEEMRLEIYRPPYLFAGPRPLIAATQSQWRHGQAVQVQSPQAPSIKWASLIKSGVTTHSFDTGQRLVDLPIEIRDNDSLSVRVPDNPNIAPPGWYMLFLTDQTGVPSVATWIHLQTP